MNKTISILGPIGSFSYKGKIINGVKLIDVISAVTSVDNLKELTVEIGSPGGSVQVAKAIRGYLKSIQPTIKVTTKQVGDMASAATILFSSGSVRKIANGINPETGKPFQSMVHNSWVTHTEGNADALEKEAKELRVTDSELAEMLVEDTGVSMEAITPLLNAETFFVGQQAIDIKFGTEIYDYIDQAAFKEDNMSKPKEEGNLLASIRELLGKAGIKLGADAPAENPLMGKAVLIDGATPPDGSYTVLKGVVTMVETVQEEAAEPAVAISKVVADALEAQKVAFDAEMVEIKKSIKTSHTPMNYKPENFADDKKEWVRSFKANEHTAMKKNDPEKFKRLFFAMYGKLPNI